MKFKSALLIALIFASLFVKLFLLGHRSFFLDELYGVCAALEQDIHLFWSEWLLYDNSPPLYYLLLRAWLFFGAESETGIRLLSVLAVCIGSFVFVNGIRKRFKEEVWFYLMVLVASNYAFLYFAQEARAYAFLLCFTSCQLLYFIDLIQAKEEKSFFKNYGGFIVFTVLSAYTHYTGLLFSILLFAAIIVNFSLSKRKLNGLFAAVAICLLAGLPWLKFLIFNLQIPKFKIQYESFGLIKMYLPMLGFGNSLPGKVASLGLIAWIAFALFRNRKRLFAISPLYSTCFILSLLAVLIITFFPFFSSMRTYRHFIVFVPLFLLFFSFTLAEMRLFIPKNTLLLLALGLLIVQGATHYKTPREEWRQAVEEVMKTAANKKASIFILGDEWKKPAAAYLMQEGEWKYMRIRRAPFYRYYFNQYPAAANFQFKVVDEHAPELEQLLMQEREKGNLIFVLNYTGDRSYNISEFRLPESFQANKKLFNAHEVYTISNELEQ